MNGNDIQQREIGDIITNVQQDGCAKNCEAHPHMVQGVVKGLRLGEQGLKYHRWQIVMAVVVLASIWLKDGSAKEAVIVFLKKWLTATVM